MRKEIDLAGQRFGRLIVINRVKKDKRNKAYWNCLCDCGNFKIIRGCNLKKGSTKSCGCLQKERMHSMCKTPTYYTWVSMIQRCSNPKRENYKYYGGRGITVCKSWLIFVNFFKDMGKKPKGLTLERKNNELGYFKENCCYASRTIQSRNQRLNKRNKTGVAGVFWYEQNQKYVVRISANDKRYHIGYFTDLKKATIARQQAEQKYWR